MEKSDSYLNLIRKKVIILFLQKGNQVELLQKDDIEQATEFYILAGYTESTAREKAIKYMLERDATYQKAISEAIL